MKTGNKTRNLVAYGSNLNCAELKRKYHINLGKPLAKVYLPDRRLSFSSYSFGRRGGVLDVPPAVGSCVEATLFQVGEREYEVIRAKEGSRYVEREGWVYADVGVRYWANYFEVRPEYREAFVRPTDNYLSIVRWGYEHYDLGTPVLADAAEGKSGQRQLPLFVYGTLMRGEIRHEFLAPFLGKGLTACEMWGKLQTNGSFPMLVDDPKRRSLVPGEAGLLDNPEKAFAVLDRIEGARSHSETSPGFYRTPVFIATQERGRVHHAWCYLWWGDLPSGVKPVKSNDWRQVSRPFWDAFEVTH